MLRRLAGGLLTSYALEPDLVITGGVYTFSRELVFTVTNVYSIRMAGVFIILLGTIAFRTRIMPRWLTFLTYSVAFILLMTISFSYWVPHLFPEWVPVISLHIMITNLHKKAAGDGSALP